MTLFASLTSTARCGHFLVQVPCDVIPGGLFPCPHRPRSKAENIMVVSSACEYARRGTCCLSPGFGPRGSEGRSCCRALCLSSGLPSPPAAPVLRARTRPAGSLPLPVRPEVGLSVGGGDAPARRPVVLTPLVPPHLGRLSASSLCFYLLSLTTPGLHGCLLTWRRARRLTLSRFCGGDLASWPAVSFRRLQEHGGGALPRLSLTVLLLAGPLPWADASCACRGVGVSCADLVSVRHPPPPCATC